MCVDQCQPLKEGLNLVCTCRSFSLTRVCVLHRSLKEQLLSLQSAVQRLQLGTPAAAAASCGSHATASSISTPVPSATAVDRESVGTPASAGSTATVSCFSSGDGSSISVTAADSTSAAGSHPSRGDSPPTSVASAASPPPDMEQSPMWGTPRPPARGAGLVRRRPDTPVPAPRPGSSRAAQPVQQPLRPDPKLRPPGLPRKRALDDGPPLDPAPPRAPAAADAPTSRIPRPAAGLPAAANAGLLRGNLHCGKPKPSMEGPHAGTTAVPTVQWDGRPMAHRPLSTIPDPKNLTTAARRVTAPTSAEKAQLAGAAGAAGGVVAAAAKAWVDKAGGEAVAAAKPWGGGVASRLIRFARGGGKGSPAVAEALSGSRDNSDSSTPDSDQQSSIRFDLSRMQRRRSAALAAPQST